MGYPAMYRALTLRPELRRPARGGAPGGRTAITLLERSLPVLRNNLDVAAPTGACARKPGSRACASTRVAAARGRGGRRPHRAERPMSHPAAPGSSPLFPVTWATQKRIRHDVLLPSLAAPRSQARPCLVGDLGASAARRRSEPAPARTPAAARALPDTFAYGTGASIPSSGRGRELGHRLREPALWAERTRRRPVLPHVRCRTRREGHRVPRPERRQQPLEARHYIIPEYDGIIYGRHRAGLHARPAVARRHHAPDFSTRELGRKEGGNA